MTRALLFLAGLLFVQVASRAESRRIAFERGTAVWVANLDGTAAKKIATGSAPSISPDGTRVAFTQDASTAKAMRRYIAVADVASAKVTVFKSEIPSDNSYRPAWSPDSAHLLFHIHVKDDWHIGMVAPDGSGFRFLKKAGPKNTSFWSSCWAADGRTIYAQDLDNLYQLDLDGSELKKWKLSALFPTGSFNSGAHFSASPDGHTLLMDVDMDESVTRKDWDGPPPSLWMLDLTTKTATRLVPKGTFAWHGCWVSENEVLFVSQGAADKEQSIHRLTPGGQDRPRLLKNADSPSVSR